MFDIIRKIVMFPQSMETFILIFLFLQLIKAPKRKYWWIGLIFTIAFSFVFNHETVQLFPWKDYSAAYTTPYLKIPGVINFGPILVFIIDVALVFSIFKVNILNVLFVGTLSYILQHLYYNVHSTIIKGFEINSNDWLGTLILTLVFIATLASYWFVLRPKINGEYALIKGKTKIAISLISIVVVNIISSWAKSSEQKNLAVYVYGIVVSLLLVFILVFSYTLTRTNFEKEQTKMALASAEREFQFAKHNYEVINRKAHDLKYYIKKNKLSKEDTLELEEQLKEFETITETGNDILNIVISEKRLICLQNNIDFSFMIDSKPMTNIEDTDLFLLLNNALDNAIECEIKEKEAKYIYFKASTFNNQFMINIENHCSDKVSFNKNVPITTKKDSDYHGIGTISMKYIVEKYGGELVFKQDKETFICLMIFSRR